METTQLTSGQSCHLTPDSSPSSLGPSCDFPLARLSAETCQVPRALHPTMREAGARVGSLPEGKDWNSRMPLLFVSGQQGIPA